MMELHGQLTDTSTLPSKLSLMYLYSAVYGQSHLSHVLGSEGSCRSYLLQEEKKNTIAFKYFILKN